MSTPNIVPFPTPESAPHGRPVPGPQRRMFLDTDFDSNWYLIPVAKRRQWEKWLEKNEDVYKPTLPRYVIVAGDDVSQIEFWVDEGDIGDAS